MDNVKIRSTLISLGSEETGHGGKIVMNGRLNLPSIESTGTTTRGGC